MCIDFEFVISVIKGNEQFDIVVLPDRRIPFQKLGSHVGFFDLVADIQVLIIPQNLDSCLVQGAFSRNQIDKR